MRSDSIGIYLGHKKINPVGFKAVYYGNKLIWMDVKSVSFTTTFLYYQTSGLSYYKYAVAELQITNTNSKLLQGKNIISVELDGRTSDVKWTFPTSGSSIKKDYLVVEATSATFREVQNKVKSDYGVSFSKNISNVVVHYTD